MNEEEKLYLEEFKTEIALENGIARKRHQIILNLIEKQNKIIDKMAGNVFLMNGDRGCTKQEIIEYFTKKVEENESNN